MSPESLKKRMPWSNPFKITFFSNLAVSGTFGIFCGEGSKFPIRVRLITAKYGGCSSRLKRMIEGGNRINFKLGMRG
jgi:hypothetical protein